MDDLSGFMSFARRPQAACIFATVMLSEMGITPGAALNRCAVFGGGTLRALFWLRNSQRTRERRLRKRSWLDAIRTASPVKYYTETARNRGLESINHQATVTHRVVVPPLLLLMSA